MFNGPTRATGRVFPNTLVFLINLSLYLVVPIFSFDLHLKFCMDLIQLGKTFFYSFHLHALGVEPTLIFVLDFLLMPLFIRTYYIDYVAYFALVLDR